MYNQPFPLDTPTKRYYPDTVFQFIVLVPMLCCYFFALVNPLFLVGGLFFQIGVGGVQVLSGLYYSIRRKSVWHKTYFFAAVGYLLFLWLLLYSLMGSGGDAIFFIFFGIFSGLIPVGIAIWYVLKSLRYHKSYVAPIDHLPFGDDELLDDIFQAEH